MSATHVVPLNRVAVIDLEATCCSDRSIPAEESETIEIGAVLTEVSSGKTLAEFHSMVRPVRHPQLTKFCRQLTNIKQWEVDEAPSFPEVFSWLCTWIQTAELDGFCSWGTFDLIQFRRDCTFHRIQYPFKMHVDLAAVFKQNYRTRRGHRGAMRKLGLTAAGSHHRALDDSRNIASMVRYLLN